MYIYRQILFGSIFFTQSILTFLPTFRTISKTNLNFRDFFESTVQLDFKNRHDKNQLGFKNQIINDQLDQISFKNRQDKNNLTLRTKIAVTKNVPKVKFDCTYEVRELFLGRTTKNLES